LFLEHSPCLPSNRPRGGGRPSASLGSSALASLPVVPYLLGTLGLEMCHCGIGRFFDVLDGIWWRVSFSRAFGSFFLWLFDFDLVPSSLHLLSVSAVRIHFMSMCHTLHGQVGVCSFDFFSVTGGHMRSFTRVLLPVLG